MKTIGDALELLLETGRALNDWQEWVTLQWSSQWEGDTWKYSPKSSASPNEKALGVFPLDGT
jgi:hypothetical protein